MALLQYLAILISAFIGFYLGAMLLPKYDEIIYPFAPNFSLLFQFYSVLFPLGIVSMLTSLISSWVYKKTMSFAALSSIVALAADYSFNLFTNLSEHYFHFSYILVYSFGVFVSYWLVKYSLKWVSAQNT